jgi:hypothetical protein
MFNSLLMNEKSSISKKINYLCGALIKSKVICPADVSKFVFLCGANKPDKSMSSRREAIINFAKKNLLNTQIILAEKVFNVFHAEGHKDNILDIEDKISDFSDFIIIILESNSSFTELGAFSNKNIRKKLIVINDKTFEKSDSFINLGPLKAIEEISGEKFILKYKMDPTGITSLDSIGAIYNDLYNLLNKTNTRHPVFLTIDNCNPAKTFNKDSVRFIHDLIYFTGPIYRKELIQVLIKIFGKEYDFKQLTHHIAMLSAFDAINITDKGLYVSKIESTYLKYHFDINLVIASFRNFYLKYIPERVYES